MKAEEIVDMAGMFGKARVLRECRGWDGKKHIVKNPDGKRPDELCTDCANRLNRLPH